MSSPKYRLALGVVALALALSACSAARGTPKAAGAGSAGFLLVNVTHLATGLDGAITVRGPGGYVQTLRSTSTLRGLAPGRYAVTAANVRAHASTFYPVVSTSPIMVTPDRGGKVTVSYLDAVLDSTKVAPNASVLSVAGRAGGPQTVILSGRRGGLSTSLVPGDVLALGATPASPHGLLGKVTSIRQSQGNLVVHVVRASLYEAVPSGSIDMSTTISSDDLHLNGTLTSLTSNPPPGNVTLAMLKPVPPSLGSAPPGGVAGGIRQLSEHLVEADSTAPPTNTKPFKKNMSCKTSDSAT